MAFYRTIQGHLLVNGGWVNISSDIRQSDLITITRGGMDEQRRPVPDRCVFLLNNRQRLYSPHNPLSAYYKKLGQNTPVTLRVLLAQDQFSDTTSSGWGSADPSGIRDALYPWTIVGSPASDFAEGSGSASHSLNGTNLFHYSSLPDVSYRDVGVYTECTVAINDITGGAIEPANILLRGTGSSPTESYYMVRVSISSAEALTVELVTEAGTSLAGPVTVTGVVDAVSSKTISVRAECEGDVIRARVWKTGTSEPAAWHLQTAKRTYTAAGWVGIRSGVATGNTNTKPIVFSYNFVEMYSPQFYGEVAKWPAAKSRDGADRTVRIEAYSMFQRLRQGETPPLKSALRRGILGMTNPAVAYWPCEDGKDATTVASDSPATPMWVSGSADFATNESFACADKLPVLSGAAFFGTIPTYTPTSGQTQIRFLLSVPAGGDTNGEKILRLWTAGGTTGFWDVLYGTGGTMTINIYDPSGSLLYTSGAVAYSLNGRPVRFSLELTQNGANIDWALSVLDLTGTGGGISNTLAGRTYGRAQWLNIGGDALFTSVAVGHITVQNQVDLIGTLLTELLAFIAEEAHQRISRLCTEEGITAYVGLTNSHNMGVQLPKSFLDLLEECPAADLGGLGTFKGQSAIRYDPLRYFYNQVPAVVVDAAAKQLDDGEPDWDNFLIRNKITVKRTSGSSFTAKQSTGRFAAVDTASGGVGIYEDSPEINVWKDEQLQDQAGYRLLQGTIDKPRWPDLAVNLASLEVRADELLTRQVIDLNLWQRVQIENAASFDLYDTVDLLNVGMTVVLSRYTHRVAINGYPYDPYRVFELDSATYGRLDMSGSTLAEDLDTTETGVDVALADSTPWGSDTPYDIDIDGERMTVTAVGSAVADAFTRSVSNGWGSADSGQAYTTSGGSASDYSVNGTQGLMSLASVNVSRWTIIDLNVADIDVAASVATGVTATGGSHFFYVAGRFIDTSNTYLARLEFTTAQAVVLSLRKRVGGSETELAAFTTGLTHAAGTRFAVRLQLFGTALQGKAWLASGAEPTGWMVSATDSDLTGPGDVAIRSLLSSLNTNTLPVTASWDDLNVPIPQRLTVTRSANGVVKTHSIGAEVHLADLNYLPGW